MDFRRRAGQVCRSRFGSLAADVFRVWIGAAVDACHASFERFVAAFRRVVKGGL